MIKLPLNSCIRFSIYSVWNLVDTAYREKWKQRIEGFLEHRYAVSSLMDTAYRMSESVSSNVSDLASSKLFTVLLAHLISLLVHGARKLFNLDLQKDALVAQNFQNLDFAVSFRRYPRGGIEESQFQELSLAFFGCSILFQRQLVLNV
ncbi:hypothetical protein Tco_0481641 [Tanacetum coccineum]